MISKNKAIREFELDDKVYELYIEIINEEIKEQENSILKKT